MENRLWRYLAWLIAIMVFILIGYSIGYGNGISKGAEFAIKIGMNFVDLNFNEDEMIKLLNLYQQFCGQHQIAECLELEGLPNL